MNSGMVNRRHYPQPRPMKTSPHLPLKALRERLGYTQDDVCTGINEFMPEAAVTRGTISAIESGAKGVSSAMLEALDHALGLPKGTLTVDYVPRGRSTKSSEVA